MCRLKFFHILKKEDKLKYVKLDLLSKSQTWCGPIGCEAEFSGDSITYIWASRKSQHYQHLYGPSAHFSKLTVIYHTWVHDGPQRKQKIQARAPSSLWDVPFERQRRMAQNSARRKMQD